MKTGKLIWVIVIIAVVLIVVAYFVGRSNLKKTAAAISNAPAANPAVTGRIVASQSNGTGSKWVIVGSGTSCPIGQSSGKDLGYGPIGKDSNGNDIYNCYISTIPRD